MYPELPFKPFGLTITTFGVMLGLAFLAAGWVASLEFDRKEHGRDVAWTLLMGALVGGIVGAKLYYSFLNWPQLVDNPLGTLFSRAGLVWYGGLTGGAIGVILMARREGLAIPVVADVAALAIPIAYAVGRVGCFLVGDDYGRPTDAWMGMAFRDGSPPSTAGNLRAYFGVDVPESIPDWQVMQVHPTQLYEVGIMLLIFAFLWRIRRHPHQPGWLFMTYLGLAGMERLFVEFFRAKDDRFFGPLTLAQLISILLILGGTAGALALRRSLQTARSRA